MTKDNLIVTPTLLENISKEILCPDKAFMITDAYLPEIKEDGLNILFEVDYTKNDSDAFPLMVTVLNTDKTEVVIKMSIDSILKTATSVKREFVVQDLVKTWIESNDVKADINKATILFNYKGYIKL